MARFASLRLAMPVAFAAILAATSALALGGCSSNRMTCASPCDQPCEAPCPAPCAAPCPAPCPAPCASPCGVVEAPPCPPSDACGEVWCKVWIPPVTCTEAETFCVRCAQKKCVWVPPVYGRRPKLTCVSPPKLKETRKPGVWTTKTREVMVQPAKEGWRRICCCPIEDACGCPMPQECYEKCCTPPVWGKEECPVCIQPELACLAYTPAKYEVVEECYVIQPGHCEEIEEPAAFDTRFREVCVRPGRWEWRRNTACELPPAGPIAIQVEMKDRDERGQEEGIFRIGAVVRYDLNVIADKSESAVKNLRVVFSLPPEIEFVSGGGEEGVVVTGGGQSAQSSVFSLPIDGSIALHVLARVKQTAKPETNIQFTATVLSSDGTQLAVETESTTIGGSGT